MLSRTNRTGPYALSSASRPASRPASRGGACRVVVGIALLALLGACASASTVGQGGYYKIGKPYRINGVWYHPHEDTAYDETGVASWYGRKFHGRPTANGEIFDRHEISAAHRTLPLPVMVHVTNLDNGKTMFIRVNDRGPFAKNRIIDLSEAAAKELGFHKEGVANVRVRYAGADGASPRQFASVDTGESETGVLSSIGSLWTPDTDIIQLFVQAGAFRDYLNALALQKTLADLGTVEVYPIYINGAPLYRVRLGPLADTDAADDMLDEVTDRGHETAHIIYE